ncbi:LysR family transcriptional regulator [Micromonospora sp. NPDC005211]|uniref:LysR family transcriptional regulator n=1 Tax=Micromonospora sp. NPDC005211 TaxID=3157023 RepID=UPI0033B66B7A
MLERYEIETFLTLAEELHFGRTGERLRVSTGRVSHVVRKLERRIGAPLFERTSRVVRLTPIGVRLAGTRSSLRDGTIDVLIASYPFDGMANGPVLMRERRVLAVAAGHPLAAEESVSLEVLGDHPVVQYPAVTSAAFKQDRTPDRTPAGRPVPKGPVGGSFSEMLALVALGRGVLPVGEQTRQFYARPDVAYVPIHDAPPISRGPVWMAENTTSRVREFVRAAADANPLPPG